LGAILFSELDMLAADVEVSAGRRGKFPRMSSS
jgi:hypothetical protein